MNDKSLKDKAVMAILGVIILYAVAIGVWFLAAEGSWKAAAKKYDREVARFNKEEKLIAEKAKWNEAYEREKAAMRMFDANEATDTTWLRKVEEIAKTNLVLITQIDAGNEADAGDVRELPIEVKSLEGSLEAIVKFMHQLENTNDGMFDISALDIQPNKSKPGYLRGSMRITCAYMRK